MRKNYNHIDIEYILDVLNNPSLMLQKEFSEWILIEKNKDLYVELRRNKEAFLAAYKISEPDVNNQWKKFNRVSKYKKMLFLYSSIAASILLLISFSYLLYFDSVENINNKEEKISCILSGTQKAILITSEGREVLLGDSVNKIIQDDGQKILADSNNVIKYVVNGKVGTQEVAYNTLKIPRGGEFQMVLSDGTKVWLNSESEIKYPVKFVGDKRVVELNGEAYFKVSRDKDKPFIVKTKSLDTKVLGTEFNINAYLNENVNITLIKGSVKLNNKLNEGPEILLKPNENALLKSNVKFFKVKKVDVKKYVAWRFGIFYFERERLEDIFIKLERWYNFNVFYQNPSVKDYEFKLRAERDAGFNNIVKRLESTNRLKIRIKGNTVIVSDVER